IQAVADWFRDKPHCEIFVTRTEMVQVSYEHHLTEVHMMFDIGGLIPQDEDVDPESPGIDAIALLTLNFIRPLHFADTAAAFASGLMEAFNLHIYDPQDDTRWTAPLDISALVARYHDHAGRALRATLSAGHDIQVHAAAGSTVRAVHDWNDTRDARQEEPEETHFLPRVDWILDGTQPRTFFVWADATVSRGLRTDHVWMLRHELAPKSGLFGGKTPWVNILPWDAFVVLCGPGLQVNEDGQFEHLWDHADDLAKRVRRFDKKGGFALDQLANHAPRRLAQSSVLDDELFA
ncbi:MAG: hypothetical protein AAF913_06400, partial [Pseudomonadota bacterium]